MDSTKTLGGKKTRHCGWQYTKRPPPPSHAEGSAVSCTARLRQSCQRDEAYDDLFPLRSSTNRHELLALAVKAQLSRTHYDNVGYA